MAAHTSPSSVCTGTMTRSAIEPPSTGPDSPSTTRPPSGRRPSSGRPAAVPVSPAARPTAPALDPSASPVISFPLGPGRHQHRAGEHSRQERTGDQRPAEFLERHGQLGQAEALPAVLLRHVQPEQALLGQAGRERLEVVRRAAVRPVGRGPHGLRRAVTLGPAPDGLR